MTIVVFCQTVLAKQGNLFLVSIFLIAISQRQITIITFANHSSTLFSSPIIQCCFSSSLIIIYFITFFSQEVESSCTSFLCVGAEMYGFEY